MKNKPCRPCRRVYARADEPFGTTLSFAADFVRLILLDEIGTPIVKPLLRHFGSGIAVLLCGGVVIFLWEWVLLEWVQKKELAAAFWLTLADLELTLSSFLFLVLWLVTSFRGQVHYIRFRGCFTYYCYCVATVVFGSLLPIVAGLAAAWLYSVRWWPVAAVARFFEVATSVGLLATVGIGIFVMMTHPFRKQESENV